jgi:hypothetical protein
MDLRQAIIDRLLEVLSDLVTEPDLVFHNRGDLPADKRPCIVLLDGDESVRPGTSRMRAVMPPTTVTLRPQVFYLVETRPPKNEGVGEEISGVRVSIIRAICNDETLINMVGGPRGNGKVAYLGCETDMKTGSSMRGELQLHFEIDYDLHPATL